MNNFQDQLGKLLNIEQLQESVKDFYDADSLMSKIQENVKLASKLIEANTSAASDAVIMQSVKLRDGVESALKQADTLAQCKNLESAMEAQKNFGEKSKDALVEQAWMNIGLAVNALETNIEIIKSSSKKA
ncbi:MAG: hypothetical protein H6995_13315 [Pseudomonadales bacterium]|nr:hypothetical protein [Pseudomonadales bacterium]MCP5215978.1 hypothetical protein [Pseudomonadales bacterium]